MINGLNIAASGLLTSMYRQDVAANNLANIQTVGYKPDFVYTISRDAARLEDGLGDLPSNRMLEQLGSGVLLAPNRVSFQQGPVEKTDDPMTIAIEGDGFLVASSGRGLGSERFRLTRDGRLALDRRSQLVLAGSGLPILDINDRPITLAPGPFRVQTDGTVVQNGVTVAQLQLAHIPQPEALLKAGQNLFIPTGATIRSRSPAAGAIRQGWVEKSGVDPIRAMTDVTTASSVVMHQTKIVQLYDELMRSTISTFARVA